MLNVRPRFGDTQLVGGAPLYSRDRSAAPQHEDCSKRHHPHHSPPVGATANLSEMEWLMSQLLVTYLCHPRPGARQLVSVLAKESLIQ
ncbi:hypothetical protein HPB52_021229 [Rhipicephalus sanguineus]|uniref:Uncharacterized protein n=1 Tax=Rhipicephalus sanguineus TaxID=34632 RepID=A0A9D4T222_RHISA|nr:hypothetical protein HPB52_021229 [Rhipicephalus sanguineus]